MGGWRQLGLPAHSDALLSFCGFFERSARREPSRRYAQLPYDLVEEDRMIDRQVLRDLLRKWQRGEITEGDVHEVAEELWQKSAPPKYDESDPRSIAVEVLMHLDIMNQQWITVEDVPAILDFLDTPPGEEARGWAEWKRYWNNIDWDARQKRLAGHGFYIA